MSKTKEEIELFLSANHIEKSELAAVLNISRPTVYAWMADKGKQKFIINAANDILTARKKHVERVTNKATNKNSDGAVAQSGNFEGSSIVNVDYKELFLEYKQLYLKTKEELDRCKKG